MNIHLILLLAVILVQIGLLIWVLCSQKMTGPQKWVFSALLFAGILWTGKAFLFPKLEAMKPTGAFAIAQETAVCVDSSRLETYQNDGSNREIPYAVWYPEGEIKPHSCPLVLFSHGSFGVKESNLTL